MLLTLILIFFSFLSLYGIVQIIGSFNCKIVNCYYNIEDIIVAGLSSLSLIVIGFKILNLHLNIQNILTVIIGLIVTIICLLLIQSKVFHKGRLSFRVLLLSFKLPKVTYGYWFLLIFSFYILRALLKAKNFSEIVYIPSRYNTDIFLYLRRISVFLNPNLAFNHQYDGVTALNILYDSPKLLSSLIYAIFTDIFYHPGIAGTILTSIILTAIVLKYVLLIQESNSPPKLFYLSIIIFLLFLPAFSWLQDQFYLSNLLYLYLLIYAVEDLLLGQSANNKSILKFTFSAIAIAGFYPSQLPFIALASIILNLLTNQQLSSKITTIVQTFIITILISLIFLPQYKATSEVTQHFNLTDSSHGVNFVYIPFWSILNLVPKPGGFKASIGSIILIIASIILTVLTTQYLASRNQKIAKYLYLSAFLYIIYSLSFLIFPGSYRQGKFFVTYIIPLALFCLLKIIQKPKIYQNSVVKVIMIMLAIYVGWNSLDRKYKSHISQNTQQNINYIKIQNKPVTIYHHGLKNSYYYISYQLSNIPVNMISSCPTKTELENSKKLDQVIVLVDTCSEVDFEHTQSNIIELNLH